MAECSFHPGRETFRSCSRCGRPACHECLVDAPVGAQCVACVRAGRPPASQRMRVRLAQPAIVTQALIAVMAAVQVVSLMGGGSSGVGLGSDNRLADDWALWGPAVRDGEWWRLLTAGFLHYGLLHILFNCWALWALGRTIESVLGRVRYLGLFVVSVLGGSAGALLLSPNALTAGASGGVFGILAAGVVVSRRAGIPFNASGYGPTLVMNIIITLTIPGISIGGHAGGAIAGALAATAMVTDVRRRNRPGRDAAAIVVLAVVFVAVAVAAAARA